MKERMISKGLVVGIILLFVGISLSSVVTAFDNDTENVDEAIDNSEIEPLDNNREIITYIHAWDEGIYVKESGYGLFHRVEIQADNIEISGIRWFLIFPIPFKEKATYVIAPRCLIFGPDHTGPGWECLFAVARGNIEWS